MRILEEDRKKISKSEKKFGSPIGIEDAVAGIDSIKASEMFAVGIGGPFEKADYQVKTTQLLKWDTIKEEFSKWTAENQ